MNVYGELSCVHLEIVFEIYVYIAFAAATFMCVYPMLLAFHQGGLRLNHLKQAYPLSLKFEMQ